MTTLVAPKMLEPNTMEFYQTVCGFSEVLAACCIHDISKIKNLVRQGADVNNERLELNREGSLHLAVRYAGPSMVKYLLEIGANPLSQNCVGDTPLHLAARFDKCSEMGLLMTETELHQALRYIKDGASCEMFPKNCEGKNFIEVAAENLSASCLQVFCECIQQQLLQNRGMDSQHSGLVETMKVVCLSPDSTMTYVNDWIAYFLKLERLTLKTTGTLRNLFHNKDKHGKTALNYAEEYGNASGNWWFFNKITDALAQCEPIQFANSEQHN